MTDQQTLAHVAIGVARLYRATLPPSGRYRGYCCGLLVIGRVVIEAAPIARWVESKGGTVMEVTP